jgi:predicted anti-sigma-YlaC factor YlaD
MNCESVKRLLSLYLYGELSFDEEELVAQHLDQCAGCRQDLQREQAMHRAMDEAEAVPPPGLLAACRRELPRSGCAAQEWHGCGRRLPRRS